MQGKTSESPSRQEEDPLPKLENLRVSDESEEREELCLYWLTRPCKQELPPATWVPLIQSMCVDGDLILFTDTGEDAARDERAVAMVHLFESVFTTSRWSWISACDETRGAGERARGAAAAAAAATWKDRALRAIPAFGRRKADASRTHLVTSPVLISRRSCLST